MVSNGLTSAITRVTSASADSAGAAASAVVSPSLAASVFAASVAAAVVVSGVFKPHPAREPATIAAHSAALTNLFFMLLFLL